MSATKKFLATAIIATSLFGGVSSASAVDTKDAAIARAQAQAAFQSQMSAHINAQRAIVDAHRAANAKALADFQAALELLLEKMKGTKSNVEFLMQIQKTTSGPNEG